MLHVMVTGFEERNMCFQNVSTLLFKNLNRIERLEDKNLFVYTQCTTF